MSQTSSPGDEHPLQPSPPVPPEAPSPRAQSHDLPLHTHTHALPSSDPGLGSHCLLPSRPATSTPPYCNPPSQRMQPKPQGPLPSSTSRSQKPRHPPCSTVPPRRPGPCPLPSRPSRQRWRWDGQEGGLLAWAQHCSAQLVLLADRLCVRCVISCGNANLNFLRRSS